MASENLTETIHTYNHPNLSAADICGEYEKVSLYELMLRSNLEPNETAELVVNSRKKGAKFLWLQLAQNVASAAAGLVGVVGMALVTEYFYEDLFSYI